MGKVLPHFPVCMVSTTKLSFCFLTAGTVSDIEFLLSYAQKGFPGGSDDKESACSTEIWVRSLGREDSPGGGPGNPLQYSCLENPVDRGAWRAAVHGVTKSQIRLKHLSNSILKIIST